MAISQLNWWVSVGTRMMPSMSRKSDTQIQARKVPQVAEVKQQAEETPWEFSWLIYG